MLRFFSSIRHSLLKEGKTVKYIKYAVGEILLIVIGIMIALQLNNWNEARKLKDQEKVILAEIHEEFLMNKEAWENNFSVYEIAHTKLGELIRAFPLDLETVDLDDLAETLDAAHSNRDYDGTTTSIDKLKSASFDILSNEELRTLLLGYEVEIRQFEAREANARKYLAETYRPTMEEKLPRPYKEGLKDPRVDLEFLESLEFEALIKIRRSNVIMILRHRQPREDRGERSISEIIDRIIELSKPEE